MKTTTKYLLGAALSLAAFTGCKDKMVELNTNPVTLGETDARFLFQGATCGGNSSWMYMYSDRGVVANRRTNQGLYMQYSSYNGGATYYDLPTDASIGMAWTSSFWDDYYVRSGQKLNYLRLRYVPEVIPAEDQEKYAEISAIAHLLQIHLAWFNLDVYGAMVYSQAFQAGEGITAPAYDLYQDIYTEMDADIKAIAATLNGAVPAGTVSLAEYDPFYGLVVTVNAAGGSTVTPLNNATTQRARWCKFANTLRLKVAHRVRNAPSVPTAYFSGVLAEVTNTANGGMISSRAESCIFKMPYTSWGDDVNDQNQADIFNCGNIAFINSLKVTGKTQVATGTYAPAGEIAGDPRLPLIARTNFNSPGFIGNANFAVIYPNADRYATNIRLLNYYFPDTVARYGYIMDSTNYFMGSSQSRYAGKYGLINNQPSGRIMSMSNSMTMTIRLKKQTGDTYIKGQNGEDVLFIDNTSWAVDKYDVTKKKYYRSTQADTTITIFPISLTQARHFVPGGGTLGYGRYDHPSTDRSLIRMTRPILTYEEHCFRMALIANETGGTAGGKTTNTWYQDGIRANMEQLNDDSKRVYVQIAVNNTYPALPPYNTDDFQGTNRRVYTITTAMIDHYLTSVGTVGSVTGNVVEDIAVQAWFALWQQPEEAWAFWKQTGYPRWIDFKPFLSTAPGALVMPTKPGMEKAQTVDGTAALVISRRLSVPSPSTADNITNYDAVKAALVARPLFKAWDRQDGRLWWDENNPAYVVD